MKTERLPTYFISHGGGPWPYMMEQSNGMFDRLAPQSLQDMPRQLGARPKAVVVISGDWEERAFTVMAGRAAADHGLRLLWLPRTYLPPSSTRRRACQRWPSRCASWSRAQGSRRGSMPSAVFDHGTFVLLVVMYPLADLPVVQLSLRVGYDPAEHLLPSAWPWRRCAITVF